MSSELFKLPAVTVALVAGACAWGAGAQPEPVRLSTTAMDSTFGAGGKRVFDLFGGLDVTFSLAVQPDLKVLLGGWADGGSVRYGTITRLNPDSSTDLGFAARGVLANREIDNFMSLKPLPDGSIVAAGTTPRGPEWGIAVMHLDRDGQIDWKFGDGSGNGYTYFDLRPGMDYPLEIVSQPDGKIVIAGVAGFGGSVDQGDFGLIRLNANGRPDTTFGAARTGRITTDFQTRPAGSDGARALALRPDGLGGGSGRGLDVGDVIVRRRFGADRTALVRNGGGSCRRFARDQEQEQKEGGGRQLGGDLEHGENRTPAVVLRGTGILHRRFFGTPVIPAGCKAVRRGGPGVVDACY
jgi:uncharacterized delta-60 repeat protein